MKNRKLYLILIITTLLFTNCKSLTSVKLEKERYDIIEESEGDLNLDGYNDLAIMVSNPDTKNGTIVLFMLDSKRNVSKKLVNKNLTNVFVESFNTLPKIEITKGELIIYDYGGMCHRESRNLIFSYNEELRDLYFKVIEISEHNVCNEQKTTENEITNTELRKTEFINYKDEL
ncbi:hypothetical protein [Mesonia sp.]|uniref:hypothetical protein n=1 Tax=Mesonia sp. TaxID=1960830 RepID=UPI003F9716D9